MKIIVGFFGFFLLSSCADLNGTGRETDRLDKRVTILEKRIDSLIHAHHAVPSASNKPVNNNLFPGGSAMANTRCQAITKKGTQCRRKAKNNSYCWQHGE
jgi:hypothetical protein